jgi:23S rRNA (adenine2503-C2)-methyltransferase
MKLIYDLTYDNLLDLLLKEGYKKYRANQIWDWLYNKKVTSFKMMSNVPGEIIEFLEKDYQFQTLDVVTTSISNDGTKKILYGLSDNNLIEAVVMKHHYGNSICITTQVGCNIGCSFCASGQLKKKRDVTVGEMVLQIIQTERVINEKIDSVVLMGIGEPFDNYDNTIDFLSILNHQKGLNIGARKITVSTSGIVPKIIEFANLKTQVNLALSLHAARDEVRSKLMKINNVYSVDKVIDAIKYYLEKTNRRVTIEYILIDSINDTKEDAEALIRLLDGMNVYINLIPYNEVLETPYKRTPLDNQKRFLHWIKQGKLDVTLRKEQGHDINAACGQLRSIQEKKIT